MTPASTSPNAPTTRPFAGHAWRSALLALTMASVMPALAGEAGVREAGGTRASAALDFRIVIPETVRFVRNEEQRDRTRQYTSRTVEFVDGRRVTTVARP